MSTKRIIKLDGYQCLDPGPLVAGADQHMGPTEFWGKANSLTCEIGREASTAWVVVSRAVFREVCSVQNREGLHVLAFVDGETTTSFVNLVVASARCMGLDGDSKAPYLIELRDIRYRLKDAGSTTLRYNMSDAMPEGTYTSLRRYETDTLNGGAEWTWQTMFADVWAQLPACAGAAPTLGYVPPHNPQAFRFDGCSAWDAVHCILDACQSALAVNPLTGVITAVALGDTQAGVDATLAGYQSKVLCDWKPLRDHQRADLPAWIRVQFRTRHRSPNTIEALDIHYRNPSIVDTTTGFASAESNRVFKIDSDLFDERDDLGTNINGSELATTAASLAARAIARYTYAGEDYRAEFSGTLTGLLPGPQIHKLVWRDFGDDEGSRTEIWQLAKWGPPTDCAPEVIRHTARMAIIELTQNTWGQSNGWAKMEGCKVVRYFVSTNNYADNAANETTVTVWHPTGYPDLHRSAVHTLHTASGLWPCKHGKDDWVWTAYNEVSQRWEIISPYEDHWRFELQANMSGGAASAKLVLYNGASWAVQNLTFTVYDSLNLFPRALNGAKGMAKYFGDSRRFEVIECDQMIFALRATLASQMCPGANASLSNVTKMTWSTFGQLPNPLPTFARNPHDLPGEAGDTVTCHWNETTAEWDVIQIEHKNKRITKTIRYNDCKIERQYFDASLPYCDPAETWDNVIQMYSHDLVTDVAKTTTQDTGGNLTSCKVEKTKKPFCLFVASPTPTTSDVFSATKYNLVSDVFEDVDDCVKQTKQEVWIVCAAASDVDSTVFCTTDQCP